MCQNADIGLVRPVGHPAGGDPGLIQVLEVKLTRLTERVPTIWIEHLPVAMQESVVGVPPVWLRIFR